MPKILSFNLYKEKEGETPLGVIIESFKSLDRFTKITVITLFLIVFSTPFIVGNLLIFNPKAQSPEDITQTPNPNEESNVIKRSGPPEFVSDQILLKFKTGTSKQTEDEILKKNNITLLDEIPQIKVKVLKVVNENARDFVIAALSRNPNVEFAERNGIAEAVIVPNDPSFSSQWGMTKIQAPQAWDVTTGSLSVPVAVLDTGIDTAHPDLMGKVLSSVNFTTSANTSDIYGHGTHVAGIVAAATNNRTGVAGLGYNSSLMNVKVLGDNGSGSWSGVAKGIIFSADNGAKVVNMSLGATTGSSTLETAVNYAWNQGAVIVAASGNNASSAPFYPAYYANIIAVAATSSELDKLAYYSNYGNWVDVAAPGSNIYSTTLNNTYGNKSGTSMASPHVAGLAALVFTRVTDINGNGIINDEVRNCIESNTDNKGSYTIFGGRVNTYKAVLCSSIVPSPTPISTPTPTKAPTATPTPVPGDNIFPTTSITSPLNGSIVTKKSIVTITANAVDNVGINKVEFYVNNSLKCTDITSPYYCAWSVPAAPNKIYQLQAKAYDTSFNSSSSTIITVTAK